MSERKFLFNINSKENPWTVVSQNNSQRERCIPCETKTEKHYKRCTPKIVHVPNTCYDENRCQPDNCLPRCDNFAGTLISVRNPDTVLTIPEVLITALIPTPVVGVTADLINWSDIVVDALNVFDNTTGTFTAPETGDYHIISVTNYQSSVPLYPDSDLTNVPLMQIYDAVTGIVLLASTFPTLNIVIPVPPMSSGELPLEIPVTSILSRAQVVIDAVVPLTAGQTVRLRAVSNGLEYNPPIILPPPVPTIDFSPVGVDTTLTIYKIRNQPLVNISIV